MPGESITEANPPPMSSQLPDSTLELAAKIPKLTLDENTLQGLKDFQKASCYIAGGMSSICPFNQFAVLHGVLFRH